jgi:hypothetical protein
MPTIPAWPNLGSMDSLAIVVLRETVDAEGATDRPIGVLLTLDIAGILGWGRA